MTPASDTYPNSNSEPVRQLDHIGVAVRDLDAALALFDRLLGIKPIRVETNETFQVREAMLPIAPGGICLQLLEPLDEHSMIAEYLRSHGTGIQQIAFRVGNLSHAVSSLEARGFPPLFDGWREGSGGSHINFLQPASTDSVMIELVEQPDARPEVTDAAKG
jgi:methylmalonyl-CoA/ethylmalonyl-CoA epimerase